MPGLRILARAVLPLGLSALSVAGVARAESPAPAGAASHPAVSPVPAGSPAIAPTTAPPRPAPTQLPAPASARPPLHPPVLTSSLARDTIAAALRAARFAESDRVLAGMATRARTSAAFPEVWLRASRSTDQSLRLAPTIDDPSNYSQLGGAGVLLEARLIWHTDRIVFDREEVTIDRLRIDRADAAARLAQRVLETLFAWQRAAVRADDSTALPEDHETAALAKTEAEVTLDVLTAGWFGARPRASLP